MKIYTRKGDDGTTGLWYGGRVGKADRGRRPTARWTRRPRARAGRAAAEPSRELYEDILRLQKELFVAGAELATAPQAAEPARGRRVGVTATMVDRLEATSTATWTASTCRPSS